jgi:hypothetical protein
MRVKVAAVSRSPDRRALDSFPGGYSAAAARFGRTQFGRT